MTTALSARNPRIQRLRRLAARRSERAAEGAFVVDGPLLVGEAVAAGIELEAVFVASGTEWSAPPGVAVHVVDGDVLRRVLDTVSSQGVAAVARLPVTGLDTVDPRLGPVLVLSGVADPGNAGTLLRSAEATGVSAVVCSDGSVDPFSPKCVRASAGSIFRVPVICEGGGLHVLQELGERGARRLGTSAHHGEPPEGTDLASPFALVVGSEAHGLRPELAASLDGLVRIPMAGAVESLNVGVAGSVVLFDAARQRRAGGR